jgi:hypothetical protein
VASHLPPPGGDFSSSSSSVRVVFCYPLVCSSGDRFLTTTRVVKLLFPPDRFDDGCDSPSFKAMEFVYLLCFCFFFLFF